MPISNTPAAPVSDDAAIVALFERLVVSAGQAIMRIYEAGPAFDLKADNSPVTAADHAAQEIILSGLRAEIPDVCCVAEEETAAGRAPMPAGTDFILVDPLDGTREFVNRRGDFTVNIALVRDGVPVVGVVYAPPSGQMFSGRPGYAEAAAVGADGKIVERRSISARSGHKPPRILASRSHRTAETDAYIAGFPGAEIVAVGSSLKFCLIAEGGADLYPRFGPTMEWDTAAGDAVLRAAGGMTRTLDGAPLRYGKRRQPPLKDFGNPDFVASGRQQ